jgi:hypothetical protein
LSDRNFFSVVRIEVIRIYKRKKKKKGRKKVRMYSYNGGKQATTPNEEVRDQGRAFASSPPLDHHTLCLNLRVKIFCHFLPSLPDRLGKCLSGDTTSYNF